MKTDEIPKLIEHLEPNLAMPDPALIRREAGRRKKVRRRVMAATGALVVVLGVGAVLAQGGGEPAVVDTAAADADPSTTGVASTASPQTTGDQLPTDRFDAREAFEGRAFFVSAMEGSPIELPPNVGHVLFDADQDRMSFTTGCEGASYQIAWRPAGFIVEQEDPGPYISPGVACTATAKLSPFAEGDVVQALAGDVAFSFDLKVLGETTWTTSIFSVERLNSASNGEVVSIPYKVVAEDLSEGEPYNVSIVENPGLVDRTDVDFETHVLLIFDLAESSSPDCQFEPMSDLVLDRSTASVYPIVLMKAQESVDDPVRCRADANPHRIIVSVARDDLPETAFSVWINGEKPPACCTDNRLLIGAGELAVDMASAGSATLASPTWESVATRIGGDILPTVVWTGERVLILNTENRGGDIVGELWDPETNTATQISDTGLIWRVGAATAWTGEELLMVGGSNGPGLDRFGVAFNPATDTWRDIANPPGVADGFWQFAGDGFWTGDEFVVPQESVAYDPATDEWHAIAEWPFGDTRVGLVEGTPDGIVMWGGCTGPAQCDETNAGLVGIGAYYRFATDTWTETSPAPLPPAVHVVGAWTGTDMMVVVTAPEDGAPAAAAYDPGQNTWRALPRPPIEGRTAAKLVLNEDRLVLWGGRAATGEDLASGAYFLPFEEEWVELPAAPQAASLFSMVDLGIGVFMSGSRQSSPQFLRMPATRDEQYSKCAIERGVDPQGVQVIFQNGKPTFVKTGVDVPAEVHLPCLEEIGGPGPGRASGSSHNQVTVG